MDNFKEYSREIVPQAVEFELADAYWIGPGGGIRGVNTTHIEDVIKSPISFGLTLE